MNKDLLDALQNYRITMMLCIRTFADSVYLNGDSNAQFRAFVKADTELCNAIAKAKKELESVPAQPPVAT